jgi:crossover junction endodeoxyribonuclease RuvC
MIVVGIDPGLAITGYGAVKKLGNSLTALEYGAITTSSESPFPDRLGQIYDGLSQVFMRCSPEVVAMEELFFAANVKTALVVGQARGVAVLAAVKAGVRVVEYKPTQVKQSIVGYGRAEKEQMQKMTRMLLSLKELPKPDDAADALALAICHIHSAGLEGKLGIG